MSGSVPTVLRDPAAQATSVPEIGLSQLSRFYGEVLGVNRVNLTIPPGITSLVGPNGSGKSTLMNLIAGLLQPTAGGVHVHQVTIDDPERFYPLIGYCTQFDTFPKGISGFNLVNSLLALHGWSKSETRDRSWAVLEKVGLVDAAHRKVAGYSKGMRQRVKLATAIGHDPRVLILDEPLNGLDPMARAEFIRLFQDRAAEGNHVVVSSHILHEVDLISDQVIMMSHGYVVAEGQIQGVRSEIQEQPSTILVRCDKPALVAQRLFSHDHVVEARISDEEKGILVRTRNTELFYGILNRIVIEEDLVVEGVIPTDDDVNSVYNYLIGTNGQSS
jgi:ABC-2 type transport system ATP-binding protein